MTEERKAEMQKHADAIAEVITTAGLAGFDVSATTCCCGGGLEISDLRGEKFGPTITIEGVN